LIQPDALIIEIEVKFVFHDRPADGCAECVGAQCWIELTNSVDGVPILACEIPEPCAVKVIGTAACDDRQVCRLSKFRTVACGVHAKFRDSLDGRKQIFARSSDAYGLYGYAVERKRSGGRQLAGECQVSGGILVHTRSERRRFDRTWRIRRTKVQWQR